MYCQFSFKFLNFDEQNNCFFSLFSFLAQFKFITYYLYDFSDMTNKNSSNDITINTSSKTNCVFCVEKNASLLNK